MFLDMPSKIWMLINEIAKTQYYHVFYVKWLYISVPYDNRSSPFRWYVALSFYGFSVAGLTIP
jgi:hypothetical protein